MHKARIEDLLKQFAARRVVVVGDVMLDEYVWGHVSRISPEAPVMVIDADRYTHVPGGAANVVNNICALGARAIIVGIAGTDRYADDLTSALTAEGADVTGILRVEGRPTTRKTRIIAHSQSVNAQVVRVDHEKRGALGDAVEADIVANLKRLIPTADAILLSDYQKGVLNRSTIRACIELAKPGQPITANLKPVALGALEGTAGLTMTTMNMYEAGLAIGRGALLEEELADAGREIMRRIASEHVLITQGSKGLTLFSRSDAGHPLHIPPRQVEVYDSAGAGDTVISVLTLSLASGATPAEAVWLANCAAAETVKKVGVATVSREEILAAVTADAQAAEGGRP